MNAAISVRSGFVAITAVALAAVGLFLPGCIKNDIPYPSIQANIRTFNAEGQSQGSVIDSTARTVTVTFPENVNIYSVDVTGYTLTPGAELLDDPFGAPVDLSVPLPVIVRLYQDYNWLIRAQQTVERYFDIEGQVGATVIDAAARRVVVDVPESMSLSSLHVARAKLGPTGSVMTPDLPDGGIIDATNPLRLVVEAWGHRQSWTIYVRQVTAKVTLSHVEPWTCVAWLSAQAEAGRDNGFEYRLKGDSEWTRLPESEITSNGGSFTGRIIHLDPTTTSEARAYSGEDLSETVEFTTEEAIQPPNMDFDSWWLDGKVWNPWAEDGIPYWDTGNKGATTLGTSNTFPTDETVSGSGWAGRLETRFVGIGTVGKIAAGNIFTGRYVRTDGTNVNTMITNVGGAAFLDPFIGCVHNGQLYYTDRNTGTSAIDVTTRGAVQGKISNSQRDTYAWQNNLIPYYGRGISYGAISNGLFRDSAGYWWWGKKYNGEGIFRFRDSDIYTTQKDAEAAGLPGPVVLNGIRASCFAIDETHQALYVWRRSPDPGLLVYRLPKINETITIEENPEVFIAMEADPVNTTDAEGLYTTQMAVDATNGRVYFCYRPANGDESGVAAGINYYDPNDKKVHKYGDTSDLGTGIVINPNPTKLF